MNLRLTDITHNSYYHYHLLSKRLNCWILLSNSFRHLFHIPQCFFQVVFCSILTITIININMKELTTRSFTPAVSSLLYMRVRQDSSCSWSIGRCRAFVGVLVSVLWALAFSWVWTPWRLSPLPCPSLSSTVLSVWYGCLFFFLLPCGGSWLGCLDLPAMGAVSI